MDMKRLGRIIVYLVATSPNWVLAWSMFPAGWGRVPLVFLAICFLVVIAWIASFKDSSKRESATKANPLRFAIFVYLAVYGFVSLAGVDWWHSFWGEQSRQDGLLMLLNLSVFAMLLPSFLKTEGHWRNFDRFLFWSAVLPALGALAEATIPSVRGYFHEASRFSAWLSNPIFLGGYLSLASFVGARLIARTRGAERIVTGIGLLACLTGVALSGSRGPVLSLVVGAIVAGIVILVAKKGRTFRRIAVGTVGAIFVATLAAFVFSSSGSLSGPVARVFDVNRYFTDNVPRLISWNIAWKGFLARPIVGWGPQNFGTVFDRFYDPSLLKYSFYETVSDKPHDLFLELLATGGVVLALAFVGLIAAMFRLLYRKMRSGTVVEAAVGIGLVVAYLVHTAFLFDAPSTSLLLFAVIGSLMASDTEPVDGRVDRFLVRMSGLKTKIPPGFRLAGTRIALVAFVVADIYAAGFGLVASAATVNATDPSAVRDEVSWKASLDQALFLPNPFRDELRKYVAFEFIRWEGANMVSADFVKRYAPEITSAIEASRSARPDDFTTAFVLGQMYSIEGSVDASPEELTKAVDAFRAALVLSPKRQIVPLQLAKVLLLGDKTDEAIALLEQVVAEDDSINEPHWFLGLALAADKRFDEASAEIQRAISLGRSPRTKKEVLYIIDLFAKSKRYQDIVPLYKLLIDQEPKNPDWHARLAATYAEMGNSGAAIGEAQTAADLDPSFAPEAESFIRSLKPTP